MPSLFNQKNPPAADAKVKTKNDFYEVPLTPAKSRRPVGEMTLLGPNHQPPLSDGKEADDDIQQSDSSCCGLLALLRRK